LVYGRVLGFNGLPAADPTTPVEEIESDHLLQGKERV
jgi:hypothetical protein